MKRIINKRGMGKTKELLEYAWSTGATVVCSNPSAMRHKAEAYNIYGLNFISYNDYEYLLNVDEYIYDKKFVVDELERLLYNNIIGYTLTNED